ncbi:MAG: hypothetical protein GXP33_03705 [Spirochaetes bacterium]|nr:hypothetical protein [Spirochaetota bacterium]
MQLPIRILAIAAFLLGVFPGIAMSPVAKIRTSFGLAAVPYSLTGIKTSADQLDILIVALVFFAGIAAGDYLRRLYTGNISTYAIYVLSAFVITAILLVRLF